MRASHELPSGQRGSNLTEYAVLAVLVVILMIVLAGRGPFPSLGRNNPLGGILNTLDDIVSNLSRVFRQSLPRIRSPLRLR